VNEKFSSRVWPPNAPQAYTPSGMSWIKSSNGPRPLPIYVFVIRTMGAWRNEKARALPVGRSPIVAAVSRECSRPTSTPSRINAVSWVGVPSSSKGNVPRNPGAAPLSPTFRTGLPKRRPRVIIARAGGFS
jgi:hypothetical protein